MDIALARGVAKDMILVMPNAYTRYFGSMYSSGATTGNWEAFVADELVAYVDAHYRTLADARSRGLAGHSMGGYGTVRIGMKRPDVFSAIYAMSSCCLSPVRVPDAEQGRRAERVAHSRRGEAARLHDEGDLRVGRRMVAEPEERTVLPRPADERRPASARRDREVDGERTADLDRPVRVEPAPPAGDRDRRRHQGRPRIRIEGARRGAHEL